MESELKRIFDIAILKEQEAYDMYKKMSEHTKTIYLKELFMTLADEEVGHREIFLQLNPSKIAIVNRDKLKDIVVDTTSKHLSSKDLKNIKDAITFAISQEQEAYDFYQKLLEQMEFSETKIFMEEIKLQEMRHRLSLEKAKRKLESGEE
ncbi:MAG: ferritin family protein [Candidatus Woesearchaeota archaeon]|jgi:rubrerythrin